MEKKRALNPGRLVIKLLCHPCEGAVCFVNNLGRISSGIEVSQLTIKASFKCELFCVVITMGYIRSVFFKAYMFSFCITTRLLLESFEKVVLGRADMTAFYIFNAVKRQIK